MTKISVLNLVPKYNDETMTDAFERAVALAQFADKHDFLRYWVAEHHNSPGVLSSATEIILAHIADHTNRIRIGAGGVMLPNHTVFQVAEKYGTLEALFPGRIDLGVGRAPGTDIETAKLIYRNTYQLESFQKAIVELLDYFSKDARDFKVAPYPGVGTNVPVTILGSSLDSATVAAELGIPYSFAGHFAPHTVEAAFRLYRRNFKPSKYLDKPYTMLGLSANIADNKTDADELEFHAIQVFLQILDVKNRKEFEKINPDEAPELTSMQKFALRTMRGLHIGGDKDEASRQWRKMKEIYQPDELIAVCYIPEYDKLEKSYEMLEDIVLND